MRRFSLLLFGTALITGSLPAKAADSYLQDEIDQIKSDIVVIQRQLYREKAIQRLLRNPCQIFRYVLANTIR